MSIASLEEDTPVAGREGARLEELYSTHAPAGLRLAILLTGDHHRAEDLVQDAFVRITGRFGHLRSRDAFGSYLNRTIVNLAKDHGRRTHLERRELQKERAALARAEQPVMPDLAGRKEILDVLVLLPYRQRAAVVLRYYQDLSEQQVADNLGCSLSAARSLITRGMETLRKQLRGELHE